jgi:hypothetical protein
MDVTEVISLGRRVREMSIMPASAACAARKRKSIECAFSELRAMVEVMWGLFGGVWRDYARRCAGVCVGIGGVVLGGAQELSLACTCGIADSCEMQSRSIEQ